MNALALLLLVQPDYAEDRFEMPAGFRIYKAADRELCGGSFDVTIDGQGRLLVGDGKQVRLLEDGDGDGVFDRSHVIATGLGPRGPQGLLVYGDSLFAVGGDGIQRYSGYSSLRPGKGMLKHEGRIGAKFSTGGDHAAHTIFRGHDDWIYFITGDGGGARERVHITEKTSPARFERSCSIFRISPDGKQWECIGTGGRNSPNLGMNPLGDLFSLDSDMEWHVSTPWWRPVRLHHWLTGGDQGWQGVGAYPPYYIDNLPGVLDVGRGSPDWGQFYEHVSFPEKYHNAYFVCDYRSKSATSGGYASSGRLFVFFFERNGAGWDVTHEVFAKPKPKSGIGFGLVDVEVAPDGSLYLSDHGQGIWRIVPPRRERHATPREPVDQLLALPQPMAEWSRLRREKLMAGLEPRLRGIAADPSEKLPRRLRALRCLSARFTEITPKYLEKLSKDPVAEIRGQAAWLIGLQGRKEGASFLVSELLEDKDGFVRRRALEALMRNHPSPGELKPVVARLEDPSRLVRYAAMIALTHHPADAWLDDAILIERPQSIMRALVAADLRRERPFGMIIAKAAGWLIKRFRGKESTEDHLDFLRLLGRFRDVLVKDKRTLNRIEEFLVSRDRESDRRIRWEKARLIGEYRFERGFGMVLGLLEAEKDPVTQFHYAQALARITGGWDAKEERRAVDWFLSVQKGWFADHAGKGRQFPGFWSTVLAEFAGHHRAALARAMDRVDFGGSLGRAVLEGLDSAEQLIGLYDAKEDPAARARVLEVLARVKGPSARTFLIRELRVLKDARLRTAALLGLARRPPTEEGRFFLEEGIRHEEPGMVRACTQALSGLRGDLTAKLSRLLIGRMEDRRQVFRACEMLLVSRSGASRKGYRKADVRKNPGEAERRNGLAFWKGWYRDRFGEAFRSIEGKGRPERSNGEVRKFLLSEGSRGGVARRGRPVYAALCARCHGGTGDLGKGAVIFGPDLSGVTKRLRPEEIVESIVDPSKVVSNRFRATTVALTNGQVLSGFVTEQDAEIVTLVEHGRVQRLARSKIRGMKPQEKSLMPELLLNRLTDGEIRDLLAFLGELGAKPEKVTGAQALHLLAGQIPVDPIDRLITRVKSPSKLRREVAGHALAAYGEAAKEKIAQAEVDRKLLDRRGHGVADAKLRGKFETLKVDLDFENTTIFTILGFISKGSQAKVLIDPSARENLDPNKQITFKSKGISAHNSLRLLGSQFGLSVFYRRGRVVLSEGEPGIGRRAPVRIGRADVAADRLIKALRSESVDDRAKAAVGLRSLNFAAEPALWKALDSKDPEVRGQAARLIRRLYTEEEGVPDAPLWTTPEEARLIEGLVADLASNTPSRWERAGKGFRKLGKRAIAPLREAARLLDKSAGARARTMRLEMER